MRALTFIYTYYDNPNMLRRQINEWRQYPDEYKQAIHFMIIDDGSEKVPALPIIQALGQEEGLGINLSLYRVLENIPWNMDGARNLGMKNAQTEWAFLCDIDHLVPVKSLTGMFGMPFKPMQTYMPIQELTDGTSLERVHPNTWLIRVEDYWSMGGYDEDMVGHYGTDGNFSRLMRAHGIKQVTSDAWRTVVYRTEDIEDANTKDWGRKQTKWALKYNKPLWKKVQGPPYIPVDPIRFKWERQV